MHRIKYAVGWVCAQLFPGKVEEVRRHFTIPDFGASRQRRGRFFVERSIRFYLAAKSKARERAVPGELEALHKKFWSNAETYFAWTKTRAEKVHIPAYRELVQRLRPLLEEKKIQAVCEWGAGDGRWLNYLSQQWAAVPVFTGIDISASQVEQSRRAFPHLTFIQSDLLEWAATNAAPLTLYHTCGGVLEYVSENSVKRLLAILRTQAAGSLMCFIEPLYGSYDLHRDTASAVIGDEHSYTHNYVHLLKAAGMEVISHEEKEVMGYRNLIVVAYNRPGR